MPIEYQGQTINSMKWNDQEVLGGSGSSEIETVFEDYPIIWKNYGSYGTVLQGSLYKVGNMALLRLETIEGMSWGYSYFNNKAFAYNVIPEGYRPATTKSAQFSTKVTASVNVYADGKVIAYSHDGSDTVKLSGVVYFWYEINT